MCVGYTHTHTHMDRCTPVLFLCCSQTAAAFCACASAFVLAPSCGWLGAGAPGTGRCSGAKEACPRGLALGGGPCPGVSLVNPPK